MPVSAREETCGALAPGPNQAGLRRIALPTGSAPILVGVVDTESEFEWHLGTDADHGQVRAAAELPRLQDTFEEAGIQACYAVDYPVASTAESAAVLRGLQARGAEIGAHLQPWSTPPFRGTIGPAQTFPGNLSIELQRDKLGSLLTSIRDAIGNDVRTYKAGRYGIGPGTMALLEEMGVAVDLSVAPPFDFSDEGGPDFSRYDSHAYWFGDSRPVLELPTTGGYIGALRRHGDGLWRAGGSAPGKLLRFRGALDRVSGLSRLRLSPEGNDLRRLKALTQALLMDGVRVFSLSLHSPSLMPGFTPYVRDAADRARLLQTIHDYGRFFMQDLGGSSLTPFGVREWLISQMSQSPQPPNSPS